jgi:hypothetical protein
MEKSNFRAAKKGGKKPNPTKQSFCAIKQENGLAQEGDKKRHQEAETSQ